MPNSKRKQVTLAVDLKGFTPKKIEKICQQIKALNDEAASQHLFVYLPQGVSPCDTKRAFLTAKDLHSAPLSYFLRMQGGNRYNRDMWWGHAGHDAFGWWEGENPFKGFAASDDFRGDITYLKNLDFKVSEEEKKGYRKPQ